ncbi:MAG TPA: FAD-binding oxidoreductase [Candidatus Dormibacteraeota bacterium]|nr:FAD-binding oxidoreductase [Candidatus Dormibacteraeota bacterium]
MTTPVVAKPRTAEELASALLEAAAAGKAVVPLGGGRASGMGGVLKRCDVELHTTGLDRVIEHSPADMVVTVEAGITLEAVEDRLKPNKQFLPIDPTPLQGHTIGGLLATGMSGPLRLRYGSARDFLIGIRVALPDGRLASAGGRVVKNVSGYDLMKLHVGALGSLGVIVAASFKVFPYPMHQARVGSDGGWEDAGRALSLPMAPVSVELSSDGRVQARLFGSPAAVHAMERQLGWRDLTAAEIVGHWENAPERWARISTPPARLRQTLDTLPAKASWWASPGVGVADWEFGSAEEVAAARKAAESAGGTLVLMAAPDDVKRQVGAWGTPPPTIEVMRRLKDAFDPGHVLNPGRFVV